MGTKTTIEYLRSNYDEIVPVTVDLFLVKKNELWGIYSLVSGLVVRVEYNAIEEASRATAPVFLKDENGESFQEELRHITLIARKGNDLTSYTLISENIVESKQLYAATDIETAENNLAKLYDKYRKFNPASERYLVFQDEFCGVWSLFDKKLLVPVEYHDIQCFDINTFLVLKNGLWGLFLVPEGETIPVEYDIIIWLNDDFFLVQKERLWGMFSPTGEIVIPVEYNKISILDDENLVLEKGGQWSVYPIPDQK